MSKKKKISALLADTTTKFAAVFFTIGASPLNSNNEVCTIDGEQPAFPNVENIKFSRHAFGQGAHIDQPCYAITFEESDQTIVIPATQVTQIILAPEVKEESVDQVAPALPV